MRGLASAVVAGVLLVLTAPLARAQGGSPLCPPGYNSAYNVNQPGCTFCFAPSDCTPQCLGPPQSFCPPGDSACCAGTPCAVNCPQHDTRDCNVSTCTCAPDTCCSTVCPAETPAPAASAFGVVVLAAVLVALGTTTVYARARRR
ncbi:MAG: hypothetical protein SF182_20375 [Deltaproteobacteria bacterium]|nr:hypothetical protein [Deltaproteobacteria bacterium]